MSSPVAVEDEEPAGAVARPGAMVARPEGADARFERLYATYAPLVVAYAMRRVDAADAEDAASQTFLIAWRRVGDVPPGDAALPWLYATCRNVIANQRRGRRRWIALLDRLGRSRERPADGIPAEGGLATDALARLRPDDRELLRLVAWEELSHAEIGQVLGISVNAVAIRLHRARGRLREQYERMRVDRELKGSSPSRTSTHAEGGMSRPRDREQLT